MSWHTGCLYFSRRSGWKLHTVLMLPDYCMNDEASSTNGTSEFWLGTPNGSAVKF